MIEWIKNNWKDPVWSKVFASGIVAFISLIFGGIWILVQLLFKQISLQDSLIEFFKVINLNVPIPLWTILIALISLLVFLIIKYFKKKNITLNLSKKEFPKSINNNITMRIIESTKTGLAQQNYNSSHESKFLGSNSGIFSIWGYVADIHNRIHPKRRFMYIVGYATNGGNPLNNPNLAVYPNAWAIQRLTPTANDNNGVWRFWCNNIAKDLTHINYNKPLSGGWHLFSVAWSREDNYIKFIIDNSVIAEEKFINWPSDFSSNIMIGTWANRAGTHFFDSNVGPWRFLESKYNEDLIKEYYNKRPE